MDSWHEQESALADLDDAASRLAADRPPAGPPELGAEPIEDAAQTVPWQRAGAFLDVAVGQRAAVHPKTALPGRSGHRGAARRAGLVLGISFPLIQADAADVPLPSGSFDLAISDCGASLWCDPARWIFEAARLLRPGGRLVFHTTTVLVTMCSPEPDGPACRELLHPQRQAYRLANPRGGIQFHPGHGDWIEILRGNGFVIDALHELYAPPDAPRSSLLHAGERRMGPPVASRGSMGRPPRRLMPSMSLLKS